MQSTRFSCHILMKLEFSRQILEKYTDIKFHKKIRPVGAELFHVDRCTDRWTDGQTHMTKLIVAFRNFAKAPKKVFGNKNNNKLIITKSKLTLVSNIITRT